MPDAARLCGSFGCDLPAGHNMGKADVPENHRIPSAALTYWEVEVLGAYNAEVYRGIVHTPEYDAKMAELQRRFNTAGWIPRRRRKLIPGGPK